MGIDMNITLSILFLSAGLSCGLLKANELDYTVVQNGGAGQTLYRFTLTNTGTTGDTLFDLFLSLPTELDNINTPTIGTPSGWGDPAGGLLFFGPDVSPATSFIEWTADAGGTHDVAIRSSLSGFSFTTLHAITGPISFALNGSTTLATAVQTSGVPEPPPPILLLPSLALLGLCVRMHSRNRHQHPPGIA